MASKEVASSETSTPIGKGDKREASSPLDAACVDSKKTRHQSGDSATSEMAITETTDFGADGMDEPVHVFTQPVNPTDIVLMARELRSLMLPEISDIIKGQLPDIKAAIKTEVTASTKALTTEIQSLRTENEKLRKDVDDLTKRLSKAESDNDALEQYTRRNSVRISGVPEDFNGENTDGIVLKIAEELEVPLNPCDIDRSHRVGKVDNKRRSAPGASPRHRDIIVKFATYNAKQRLFQKRMDLREIEERQNVFVNEDLTRTRSKLLYNARTLMRAKTLKSAYSSDGKIFIRDNDDNRLVVKSDSDILEYGDPEEARKQLEREKRPRYRNLLATPRFFHTPSGN